ncbi:uncharacterized protein [Nicotiana sylvestris]|uniref:uncharacterized protein n=1 Tax=Nicotiana sylvestris TaxID=4096 RepID=UPI00388CC663
MEGVSMMVNKRRQNGPHVQNPVENYVQDDSGFDQDKQYNEQEEEQALNTRPKGALTSDTVVNPKVRNNTAHAMAITTRSEKDGDATTSSQKKLLDDEKMVQQDEILKNEVQEIDEVRIDIDDNVEETHEELNQSSLSINVQLVEALDQMSGYAKFMKDLVTKNRSMNCETLKMTHQVSEIVHSMAPKLKDPGAFTIPCTIGSADFAKALCDLGASINLMTYSDFKTLWIGKPRTTSMRLQMANVTMNRPLGIIDDVLVGDKKVVFHVHKSMRKPNSNEVCLFVDLVIDVIINETSAVMNVDDTLEAVLLNCDDQEMECYVECVDSTLKVLQKRKKAIGWTLADIQGISPIFCMHKINLEEGSKPSIEHQRRLNEAM